MKLGILLMIFALNSSQAASGSHVANAVFVTVTPTVKPSVKLLEGGRLESYRSLLF